MRPKELKMPFTEGEFRAAAREWGCNCGPSALAFALRMPLDHARSAIAGFDEKRYTSPMMMRGALDRLCVPCGSYTKHLEHAHMFKGSPSLVRIQWGGPWTTEGVDPRRAYRHTHWIATFVGPGFSVFDCNAGVVSFGDWKSWTIPFIGNESLDSPQP